MPSSSSASFFKRGQMGRGLWETLLTLPRRAWQRCHIEHMTTEEKACAQLSDAVYHVPGKRSTEKCYLGGYRLVEDEIPAVGDLPAIPLNDKRWAVYRAPDKVGHVLAFRGTAEREDLRHDLTLNSGFGEHEYMFDAAVWTMRVVTFLASQHKEGGSHTFSDPSLGAVAIGISLLLLYAVNVALWFLPQAPLLAAGVALWSIKVTRSLVRKSSKNGDKKGDTGGLKFLVTGHSLGGAVAMGVFLMLHDIPATAQHLEKDARSLAAGPDFKRFKREVVDVWYAAIVQRGLVPGLSFDLVGGHVFNPGAIPGTPDAPRAQIASTVAGGSIAEAITWLSYISSGSSPLVINGAGYVTSLSVAEMAWAAALNIGVGVGIFLGASALATKLFHTHRARLRGSLDKQVTTHHILGDLLSCSFRMGTEKSYSPRLTNFHTIGNFLFDEHQKAPSVNYVCVEI